MSKFFVGKFPVAVSRSHCVSSLALRASLGGGLLFLPLIGDARAESSQGGPQGLVVVDVQNVIANSKLGRLAKTHIEDEVKKEEEALKGEEKNLRALEGEFEKQKSMLSGAALEQKATELGKKRRDLARKVQDKQEAIDQKKRREIGKIVAIVDKAVKDLAKEKGYLFVLERDPRFVVHAGKGLDVTDEVIKRVDG